jgi:predicted RNA-binding Zn-ribbon protein involved in translation (DUF1610 family)
MNERSLEFALRSRMSMCGWCLEPVMPDQLFRWKCPECGQKKYSGMRDAPVCPNLDCMLDDIHMELLRQYEYSE